MYEESVPNESQKYHEMVTLVHLGASVYEAGL